MLVVHLFGLHTYALSEIPSASLKLKYSCTAVDKQL